MNLSLFTTISIAVLLFYLFLLLYKKWKKDPDAITAKFETSKPIALPIEEASRAVAAALEQSGFVDILPHEEDLSFVATNKISMSSWAENIKVSIEPQKEGSIVHFKSVCALPTQVVDWGRNKKNFIKFDAELGKLEKARLS